MAVTLLRFRIKLEVDRIRKVHLAQPAEIENQISASKEQRSSFVKSVKVNTADNRKARLFLLSVLKQATVLTALAWLLITKELIHCLHSKDLYIKGYHEYREISTPSMEQVLGDEIVGHLKKGRTGRFAKTVFYSLSGSVNLFKGVNVIDIRT